MVKKIPTPKKKPMTPKEKGEEGYIIPKERAFAKSTQSDRTGPGVSHTKAPKPKLKPKKKGY